jgi:hypothetical protein
VTVLYIAGPMTGLPEKNLPAFFEAEERLRAVGYLVANPARIDEQHREAEPGCVTCGLELDHGHEWYMNHCLPMVEQADGLALLPGWRTSQGAMRELERALELGLAVAVLDVWVSRHRTLQRDV